MGLRVLSLAAFIAMMPAGGLTSTDVRPPERQAVLDTTPTATVAAPRVTSDIGVSRPITLGVGKSVIIDLPRDAAEVFIGSPKVADAVIRTPRQLYVIGVDNGQTSAFALDHAGHPIAAFQISVGRDVGQLQRILATALPRARILARTVGDTIILTGSVDSAADAQQAVDIAKGFLGTSVVGTTAVSGQVVDALTIRAKDQVMLKVSVVEVRRAVLKELGINIDGSWSTGAFAFATPLTLNGSVSALSNTFKSGSTSITPTLQALERYGVSHVIAEPTVTAISGETAKFTAGGEIPVPSSETCSPGTIFSPTQCVVGIQFKTYGVTLNFTPVVLSEGRILLHIATEVTEIDQDKFFQFQTITVNGFRTRKNETSVELPSGGSVVSAGLLQTTSRQVLAGLPALTDLPVLGALFRSRDYQREETELMVIVTPYIARPLNPQEVARPDDGFTDASDPQGWFLGRVNRIYAGPGNAKALQSFKGGVGFIND